MKKILALLIVLMVFAFAVAAPIARAQTRLPDRSKTWTVCQSDKAVCDFKKIQDAVSKTGHGNIPIGKQGRERRQHLLDEGHWVSCVLEPQIVDLAVRWQKTGAEQEIPDDQVVTVVRVRFQRHSGVVPAMQFCTADDVVQEPELHAHVGVLKKTVHRIQNEVQRQYRPADAKQKIKKKNC